MHVNIPISCLPQEACCGAYNYSDYQSPDFNWNKQVMPPETAVVPISCCKKADGAPDETPTKSDDFDHLQKCLDGEEPYINSKVFYITVYFTCN